MKLERIEASDDPIADAAALRALVPHPRSVTEAVAEIVAQVHSHGDAAVRDYTRRFDTAGAAPPPASVPGEELAAAGRALDAKHDRQSCHSLATDQGNFRLPPLAGCSGDD